MTPEQKQRAAELLAAWRATTYVLHADAMAALLEELINAPEPEPVMWKIFDEEWEEETTLAKVAEQYKKEGHTVIAYYTAPPAPSVPDGHVYVYVSGLTGSGKSAVAGEIEIALRASGLDVEWVDSESEKHLTHADYTSALELYRPKVRIFEKNISRTATPAPSVPDGWRPFLTDVITAAGLLGHGKRDKGLAERIGSFAFDVMFAAPPPPKLSDERILEIYASESGRPVTMGKARIIAQARAIEREILGEIEK